MKCRLALLLAPTLLWATLGQAQSAMNGISVTVTDLQGAVIPGASVETVLEARHFKTVALTNDAGMCLLPHLPVGKYLVKVKKRGFRTKEVSIEIGVDGVQKLEVQLVGIHEKPATPTK